jgi:hypothetical protein
MKKIWEILVPTQTNEGRPIRIRQHKVWDELVRDITGGLTIMPPNIKGEWVSPQGDIFAERMIPVRIYCTENQILTIASATKKFYEQEAIMYYCISNDVRIYE